jgi:NADPH:quinone reductase-like Zn-dependent oxidoreductase
MYRDAPPIPCVVGYEVSGVVDAVGAGVAGIAVGDRVCGMPEFGGYSDTVVVPAGQVVHLAEGMSFEEGAAMPVVYLTAHHLMLFTGHLRPGARVLIHSAAGGVGVAAVQLARTRDCVIFGTASPSKHEFLRGLGVQHPIDGSGDWEKAVRDVVGETGLDLVLDAIGGAAWKRGYRLLGPAGRLACFGVSAMSPGKTRNLLAAIRMLLAMPWFSPVRLMTDNKSVTGCNMKQLFARIDILRPQFDALMDLYRAGRIKPHVDRTFRFDEAPAAHHYLHDRKAKGKVLLVP